MKSIFKHTYLILATTVLVGLVLGSFHYHQADVFIDTDVEAPYISQDVSSCPICACHFLTEFKADFSTSTPLTPVEVILFSEENYLPLPDVSTKFGRAPPFIA